jgi:hypothetical protein
MTSVYGGVPAEEENVAQPMHDEPQITAGPEVTVVLHCAIISCIIMKQEIIKSNFFFMPDNF